MNKQIMILELTALCNSRCADCLRAGLNHENYQLSFDEIKKAINEIKEFSSNYSSFELKLSGGEPTIWMDKKSNKNIIDIIEECENSKINYSLVSNGKIFSFDKKCKLFFNQLYERKIQKLKLYITIDKFHDNYLGTKNIIIDNILKYNKLNELDFYVQSTVTKNKEDNLSMEFIKKYTKKGIKFMLNPLLPWGRGKNLETVVPYINLKNNDKETLGDYKDYYYVLGKSNNAWQSYEDYLKMDNVETIKKLNCCGKTITFMENKYYYSMPCSGNENFCFAELGTLNYKKYTDFVKKNKLINKMKNNEISEKDLIEKCPIGYGICGLCKENNYEL